MVSGFRVDFVFILYCLFNLVAFTRYDDTNMKPISGLVAIWFSFGVVFYNFVDFAYFVCRKLIIPNYLLFSFLLYSSFGTFFNYCLVRPCFTLFAFLSSTTVEDEQDLSLGRLNEYKKEKVCIMI